ncbi:hypothetical protein NY78_3976 [Desulfovibrio sp. TomC]|nr:hypothetical protein NY78_3976 [Desulfovibrio sp. TomC]
MPERGRKEAIGRPFGLVQMKKAFREPPEKPFCKMFIQRKVFFL